MSMEDLQSEATLMLNEVQNLCAATGIAMLFLDDELRVLRYTPLIPSSRSPPKRRSGARLVIADMTERKRAEESTVHGQKRLAAILDQLPIAVGVLDGNGDYILSNSSMHSLVQMQAAHVDAEKLKSCEVFTAEGVPVPPDQWPNARALRGEKLTPGIAFHWRDEHGQTQWYLVSAVPMTLDEDAQAPLSWPGYFQP